MQSAETIRRQIKAWLTFFMIALVISGVTAFALQKELSWLCHTTGNRKSALYVWVYKVYLALRDTNLKYPYLAYGYDWLAFAHLVIAVAFIGPLRDPVRNKWLIQFGMIACCAIFPLAFIAGYVRGIPFYWQLIDCSFGVLGFIPLCICYYKVGLLENHIETSIKNENRNKSVVLQSCVSNEFIGSIE